SHLWSLPPARAADSRLPDARFRLFIVARRGRGPRSDKSRLPVEPSPPLEEQEALQPAAPLPYVRQRYLLSQAEREFFTVLQRAAPSGWYVFPQVPLANLVQLRKGTRNWKPHFGCIAQKCVDFVRTVKRSTKRSRALQPTAKRAW